MAENPDDNPFTLIDDILGTVISRNASVSLSDIILDNLGGIQTVNIGDEETPS